MSKYIIRNQNGQLGREANGQYGITTAGRKNELKAEREQRAAELKAEMGDWAATMGIDPDDLRGLFA